MSTNVLTPQQAHALLDILSHNEVYQEIQDFRAPGTLGTYGSPFNDVSPSTSPALQALVTRFATTVPGLRDIDPQFWHTQVEPIIESFEQAELSESYDKGHLGIRKTLATALSALLEYPVRGIFAGFDEPKPEDRNRKYDTTSSEDLQLACRDFLHEVVYSDLLDSMVEKAATTDQLSDHRPIVQAAHEYGLVNLASFLHYVLIISPKGQHILNMVDHANKLVPYMIIRQTLKIGNVASMISAMMRVVLAKVSMASVTNWVGWTKDANEGMNLMQTIVSTVLQFDMKEFKSKANKIEKDKKCPSKEHLKALNAYVEMSREEHERIRAASEQEGKSIVAAIFEAASIKGKLTDEQHTQSLEYLAMKLSVRDREQITNVLCRSNPDHLTQIVRDVVGTYEPIIRHVHKAVNLSETVLDFEYFLKDLIKLAKIPSQTAASGSYLALHKHRSSQDSSKNRPSPATVGDFVFLLKRHQYSFHRFLHQCAKNGKELTSMFVDYAKAACAHFRKSSSSSAPGVPAPSMYSSKADAGELADPLRNLFAQLPEAKQKELIPILEAHNSYIDALHESSSLRLRSVLASPRSNHPIFQTPSHHQQSQPPSQTISRSGSPEPKPVSMQSSPALGPVRSADKSLAMIDPGPGAFLARWQALLDATAITPASPQGAVRRGMNPSVLDASRTELGLQPGSSTSQLSHSSTADSSMSSTGSLASQDTTKGASIESASAGYDANDDEDDDDEFHDAVEKVMEIHVAGSDKVIKISRPDTTPVIQALEPQFRALLGMVSVENKSKP